LRLKKPTCYRSVLGTMDRILCFGLPDIGVVSVREVISLTFKKERFKNRPCHFEKDVVFNPLVFYSWLDMDDPSNISHVLELLVREEFDHVIVF